MSELVKAINALDGARVRDIVSRTKAEELRKPIPEILDGVSGTVLSLAILKGGTGMCKDIIDAGGFDPNSTDIEPVVYAVRAGKYMSVRRNIHLLDMLVEAGADLDKWDVLEDGQNFRNPLMCACMNNPYTDILEHIIEKGATLDAQNSLNMTALHHAVSAGNCSHVRMLLSYGADTSIKNSKGETPYTYALRLNQSDKILELLK